MSPVQWIGIFLSGIIAISALSLIVAPGSTFGAGVSAIGNAISTDVNAAKH